MAAVTTNRFVEISAGSERLEIRRYEDSDERIDLNRVQEDCVGKRIRPLCRARSAHGGGLAKKILTYSFG